MAHFLGWLNVSFWISLVSLANQSKPLSLCRSTIDIPACETNASFLCKGPVNVFSARIVLEILGVQNPFHNAAEP